MCVNQKCMSVDSLRAMRSKCPQDCNGNGICNSLGRCHCKDGFSPPFCDYPGPGGSTDSGPASDPNARREFIMAMYIVFLGIIPLIAIVAVLMYYMKHNTLFKWQKPGPTYVFACIEDCGRACCSVLSACYRKQRKAPSIPTLSHQVAARTEKNIFLDIQQTGLISTTNECLLNGNSYSNLFESSSAPKRKSLKNIKGLRVDIKPVRHFGGGYKQGVVTPKTTETMCLHDDTPKVSVKKLASNFQNGAGTSYNC